MKKTNFTYQVCLAMGLALSSFQVVGQTQSGEDLYASLSAQMEEACPQVWESLGAEMNTESLSGPVWAAGPEGDQDKAEFIALLESILPDETPEALAAMADDTATVATECASHRVALLDALISKTPRDVLLAMDAVNKGLSKTVEHLDGGWSTGDIRVTGRDEPQDGWLFLNGATIGRDGSGATYEGEEFYELFQLANKWPPNNNSKSWEGSGAASQVILPDLRGRTVVAADNMGGTPAGVLTSPHAVTIGGAFGSQGRPLTVAQLPSHNHGMNAAGTHSHPMQYAGNHGHRLRSSVYTGSSAGRSDWHYFEGRARPNYQNLIGSGSVEAGGNHKHTMSNAGSHAHAIHHTGSGGTVWIVQPSMAFNIEMKY